MPRHAAMPRLASPVDRVAHLELFVDLLHNVQHALHFPEKLLRDVALCAAAQHAADLAHHAAHRALRE
eukprot:359814-Chlamydomonas_euryale.AAC.6